MNRRELLKLAPLATLAGCGLSRIDPWHVLIRSDSIRSLEAEAEILSRGRTGWTDDGRIRVLHVSGTPYERGYQHGALLRREVNDNLGYMYRRAKKTFHFEEIFAEAFERMRPFIPTEYIEEMHGLAHGARMPLHVIHHIHALPSITEWGGKKRLKGIVKQMMDGEFGTSCSNISATGDATSGGEPYAVRVLDWGLHKISKLHEYPLLTVTHHPSGITNVNVGWVGFLGAVSGMNAEGITLGEMGYGDPPNETLAGRPMPFVLRDILSYAKDLGDVRRIIKDSPGDNSFAYVMTDGKTGLGELYIRDRDRFIVFEHGSDIAEGEKNFPGIPGMVYGGHFDAKMTELLGRYQGQLTPELLMREIIPQIAMKSNFHNVIYRPRALQLWVSNARSPEERAAEQPYTFFDLRQALAGDTRM